MVVVKEIKPNDMIMYDHIKSIVFSDKDESVYFDKIITFVEDSNEVKIKTYLPCMMLQRGWVGNIYYETGGGYDCKTDTSVNTTYTKTIKDVLLARVTTEHEGRGNAVIFTYTFLKC